MAAVQAWTTWHVATHIWRDHCLMYSREFIAGLSSAMNERPKDKQPSQH
jgi:hypothetical protein